jgi:L-aminopeptidase/D-esterase-like protein
MSALRDAYRAHRRLRAVDLLLPQLPGSPPTQAAPARRGSKGEPMSEPPPLPEGFSVGHWSDPDARTGCTAVITPPQARGGADVRGGGPGTRETDVIDPMAGSHQVTGVVLAGGSAFGLAAADGAARWLEEQGRGYPTPGGLVPIVPAAVVYDLIEGDASVRPGPEQGYAACEAARPGVPGRGLVGAGSGTAVGKLFGRTGATAVGVGYAAAESGRGEVVAALAVVNAFGDVIAEDGSILAGPRSDDGRICSTAEEIARMQSPPDWTRLEERNTTLVCLMTDAPLTTPGCTRVARMGSGGVARAVDPTFSDVDGDVVFCLASGQGEPDRFTSISVGTIAATVTAAAIRDAVRSA